MIARAVFAIIATHFAVYLFSAFVAWDLNPGTWTNDGRFFAALIAFVVGLPCAVVAATRPRLTPHDT